MVFPMVQLPVEVRWELEWQSGVPGNIVVMKFLLPNLIWTEKNLTVNVHNMASVPALFPRFSGMDLEIKLKLETQLEMVGFHLEIQCLHS